MSHFSVLPRILQYDGATCTTGWYLNQVAILVYVATCFSFQKPFIQYSSKNVSQFFHTADFTVLDHDSRG